MGHARGVILLAVRAAGVRLVELRPNEIKKFLTGNGHASKEADAGGGAVSPASAAPPERADVADAYRDLALRCDAAVLSKRESRRTAWCWS
jgi:crossover junction endodeoxyribonuclease RuvC